MIVLDYLILDYTFRALSNALSFVNFTWGLFSLQHCLKPLSHSLIPDWICLVIYVLAFRDISFSQSLCIGSSSSSKVLMQSWNASKAVLAASWQVILRKNIVPWNICYSFVLNCTRGLYCIFSNFLPQNHFIMTPPPFYQNGKLGPTPHFIINPPPPNMLTIILKQVYLNYSTLFLELWWFINNWLIINTYQLQINACYFSQIVFKYRLLIITKNRH